MALDKSYEQIATQLNPGSVSGEVMHLHGQEAAGSLIREYGLDKQWNIKSGTKFESAFKS